MGQGAERRGEIGKTGLKQNTGLGSTHWPLKSELDCCVPECFSMTGIRGKGGVNEFFHQHTQHLDWLS